MKIVINICHGGFGLSAAAEAMYAKKSGFEIFRYTQTKYKHRDGKNLYEKTNGADHHTSHTFKKDLGDSFSEWPDSEDGDYWYSNDIKRDDLVLIEVVDLLGSEAASGMCGELSVVEVPDGVSWEIEEYDGLERVSETHRTWP